MFFLSFPRTFLILPLCHTSTPSQPSSYLSLLFRYPSYHQSVNAGCTRIHRSHLDACFVRVHASARLLVHHADFCHSVALVKFFLSFLRTRLILSICLACPPLPHPPPIFASLSGNHQSAHAGCTRMQQLHLDVCFVHVHVSTLQSYIQFHFGHIVALVMSIS